MDIAFVWYLVKMWYWIFYADFSSILNYDTKTDKGGMNCRVGSPRKFFIFSAHSALTTFLQQKVSYFNVSRQNCLNYRLLLSLTHSRSLSGSLLHILAPYDSICLTLALSDAHQPTRSLLSSQCRGRVAAVYTSLIQHMV